MSSARHSTETKTVIPSRHHHGNRRRPERVCRKSREHTPGGCNPGSQQGERTDKESTYLQYEMKTDGLAENIKNGLSEAVKADLYKSVDKVIKDGISSTYAQSVSYLKNAVNDLRYEVNRVISGHWWLAMPKWAKITAIVSVLAAIGFAIGFFYMVSENKKYQKVEWLYRYERVSYDADGIRNMMLREEAMMVGTHQEQDSIKAITIRLERRKNAERTHVYFRPSDSWTPESKSIW